MNFYPEDYIVELTVPFVDANGSPVVPTAVKAHLLNGEGVVLNDMGSIPFVASEGQKVITIPAILNRLSDTEVREVRVLRVELVTATGSIWKSHPYVVEDEQTIKPLVNSFQGYEAATVLALDYVNLPGWSVADETRRRAALVEAWKRLIRVPLKYFNRDIDGTPMTATETKVPVEFWISTGLQDAYAVLPSALKRALRQAQLLEANEILAGDTVGRKHRAGIISETIGETSVTLNKAHAEYGLSRAALAALGAYVDYSVRLSRV